MKNENTHEVAFNKVRATFKNQFWHSQLMRIILLIILTSSAFKAQNDTLTLTVTTTNSICGIANGSAAVTVTGGTGPYGYQWSNGGSTNTINNLCAGWYSVLVFDAIGDTTFQYVMVNCSNVMNQLSVYAYSGCDTISNGDSTNSAFGYLVANASGGVQPYTYLWSHGKTTASDYNVSNGTYMVTVIDANNNYDSSIVVVNCSNVTNQLTVYAYSGCDSAAVNGDSTALNRGNFNAYTNAGAPPYSYLWSNGSTSASSSNVSNGTYTVTITDANNKTGSTSVIVNCSNINNQLLVYAYSGCDTLANGDTTNTNFGYFMASASGGTFPYTYLWSNGTASPSDMYVANGTYVVTVTDAQNNTATSTVYVNCSNIQLPLLINAWSYCDTLTANMGYVGSSTSGGLAPYYYKWSNGVTTQSLGNVVNGSYTVTVTDAANAAATTTVIVSCSNTSNICKADFTWYTDSTDTNTIWIVNQSVAPYQVWNMGDSTTIVGNSGSYVYADSGLYTICLTVIDSVNNCSDTKCDSLKFFKMAPIYKVNIIYKPLSAGVQEAINTGAEMTAYPNPVKDVLNVAYETSKSALVMIEIYDVLGNKVVVVENQNKSAGTYNTQVNTNDMNTGIYMVRLSIDGQLSTKRIVVVK